MLVLEAAVAGGDRLERRLLDRDRDVEVTTPVSQATWKGVQGDPNATLTDSDASIYYLWGGVTDPTYSDTNRVLAFNRLQLQNRAIQQGAPSIRELSIAASSPSGPGGCS